MSINQSASPTHTQSQQTERINTVLTNQVFKSQKVTNEHGCIVSS